jgi:acyl-CoA thioesterase-1
MSLLLALALVHAAGPSRAAPVILVYGDSLSAAYGLPEKSGWPELLAQRLKSERLDYTVVNASISGEITSGGLARLPKVLAQHRPAVVIIALGGNDGLRGLPAAQMKSNLSQMVREARRAGARTVLVGMRMPPNYGPDYTAAFARVYREVAKEEKAALVPFLLEGVADRRELFLDDNIHPSAAGQPYALDNVWKVLGPLLRKR